ncbi:hypothetical protein OG912_14880 [Streptomyces sp. NBC_00464]|uniref:hypothetical protein n=1 Tax=Streptomyces sp. NBC_00464 TaxID=2975751 RepID=UPI002E196059
MPLIPLVIEQLAQWKLGLLGGVSASLLVTGCKLGNTTCVVIGSVSLALLLNSSGQH